MNSENNNTENQGASNTSLIVLLGLLVVLIGLIISVSSSNKEPEKQVEETKQEKVVSTRELKCTHSVDAYLYFRDAVKRLLRSPSTAKFEVHKSEKIVINRNDEEGFCSYTLLDTWVDGQNAFGATQRMRYDWSVEIFDNKTQKIKVFVFDDTVIVNNMDK